MVQEISPVLDNTLNTFNAVLIALSGHKLKLCSLGNRRLVYGAKGILHKVFGRLTVSRNWFSPTNFIT